MSYSQSCLVRRIDLSTPATVMHMVSADVSGVEEVLHVVLLHGNVKNKNKKIHSLLVYHQKCLKIISTSLVT